MLSLISCWYSHTISAALLLNTHWVQIKLSMMVLHGTALDWIPVCNCSHPAKDYSFVIRTFAACGDANSLSVLWWKFFLYYEIKRDFKSDWHCLLTLLKMCSIELALSNLCPFFVFQSLALHPQFCINIFDDIFICGHVNIWINLSNLWEKCDVYLN